MAKIEKEILLRFRGDTKPLEQDARRTEKLVQNMQKNMGGSGQQGLGKTLDTYIKQSEKFGGTINKDMTRFQKTLQDVATKDLKVLQQQTDSLFRKTEDRLQKMRQAEKNIADMKANGASSSRIAKQQRKMMRYGAEHESALGDFMESASQYNTMSGGMQPPGQPPSTFQKMMGGVGKGLSVVAGVAQAANMYYDTAYAYNEAKEQNKANLAATVKQRKVDRYSGNLTESMMEQKDQITSLSTKYAREQADKKNKQDLAKMIGGAAMIGVGLMASPFTGGLSLGGVLGGAALLGGASLGASGFMGLAGKEGREENIRKEQVERLKTQSMTDVHYQYLREKAPQRYEFQRQAKMNDAEARAFRMAGYDNLFNEQESTNTYMALKHRLGNSAGKTAAIQAMELSRNQGISLQSATGLAGTLGMSGAGGAGSVKKTLSDIYSDAFTKGITDSGLIEAFQTGMAELASRSPDVTDIASISAKMTENISTLTSGRDVTARDMNGAMQAQQMMGDYSMQGGLAGFTKLSRLAEMTGGNMKAMAFFANRTDEENMQLLKNNDPRALRAVGGKEEAARLLEEMGPASTLAKTLGTTQEGSRTIAEIKERLSKGERVKDIAEMMGLDFETVPGMSKMSLEASSNIALEAMKQLAKTDPLLKKQLQIDEDQTRAENISSAKKGLTTGDPSAIKKAAALYAAEIKAGRDGKAILDGTSVDQQNQIMAQAAAGANNMAGRAATNGTVAGAQMAANAAGMADIDKATADFTGDQIANAAELTRQGAAPALNVGQSVDTLKAALDGFVRALETTNNSSTRASGVSYGN